MELDPLRRLLDKYFAGRQVALVECRRDGMHAVLAPWIDSGVKLIIAAGGDGTLSDVVTGIPPHGPVVGLLPLGTGNVVARELGIPIRLENAVALLAGDFAVRDLDVMRVEQRAYLLSVSAGFGAWAMKATTPRRKRIFGKSSYLVTLFLNFFSMTVHDYQIDLDGRKLHIKATEMMASNCGILGYRNLRWWPQVLPDDGQLDLCYLKARTGFRYLWVIFNFLAKHYPRRPWLNYVSGQRSITIEGPPGLPVQGDGDWIGETPVTITLQPGFAKLAVPRS